MTNPCYNEVYYIEAFLLFYVNCQQAYNSQENGKSYFLDKQDIIEPRTCDSPTMWHFEQV